MSLLKFKLDSVNVNIIEEKSGIYSSNVQKKYKPKAFINGALYDMGSKTNITKLLTDNKASGYLFSEQGMGIKDGKPIWTTLVKAKADDNIKDYISGSPVLVENGKISIQWGNKVSSVVKNPAKRSAIGFNDTEIILYCSDDSISLDVLAKRMLDYGCKFGLNLDGGGSSHIQEGSNIYHNSIRNNPTWILIEDKKGVIVKPEPPKPIEKPEQSKPVVKPQTSKHVIIDIGHSDVVKGKRAFDGSMTEYEFNLATATRIKYHLNRHKVPCSTIMVRSSDLGNEMATRVKQANAIKDSILVSIHANANGETWNDANGWEILSYKLEGESQKLAKCIHDETIPYLGLRDRGIKDGSKLSDIICKTIMPSVLVEHGFYTNLKELALLKTYEFREKCAIADVKGILKYLNVAWIEEKKEESVSDTVFKVQVGAFSNKDNAEKVAEELKSKGYKPVIKEDK